MDAEVRVSASLQQHADDGRVSGVAGQQQGRLKHSQGRVNNLQVENQGALEMVVIQLFALKTFQSEHT